MPDSKVEVKAYCLVRKCCACDAMDMAYDKGDGEAETLMRCSDMGCGHQGLFKITKYEESTPIANNGVSFDSIVDKLTHLNGDHLMGLELNNIHIIANFITKLPTTAPRGGQ